MRVQQKQVAKLVYTMYAIASSPLVKEFVVGLTARPGWSRRAEYKRRNYNHLAVIADGLTRDAALDLERCLQEMVKVDKRWQLWRRYDPTRREKRHYPSYGAGTADAWSRATQSTWRGAAKGQVSRHSSLRCAMSGI